MGGGQILDLGSPTAGWTSFNMCLVTSQDNTVGFRFVYGVAGDRTGVAEVHILSDGLPGDGLSSRSY